MPKKFCLVDGCFKVAVGVESPDLPSTAWMDERVADIRLHPKRDAYQVYFSLDEASNTIKVSVPEFIVAPFGVVLLNNNVNGTHVVFGRKGERKAFGFEQGQYVGLRLFREKDHAFRPVFVRVRKGPETRFLLLRASWEHNDITVTVIRNPSRAPAFLLR